MRWHYLSIPNLQPYQSFKSFHHAFCWAYGYICMLGLKLIHISKGAPKVYIYIYMILNHNNPRQSVNRSHFSSGCHYNYDHRVSVGASINSFLMRCYSDCRCWAWVLLLRARLKLNQSEFSGIGHSNAMLRPQVLLTLNLVILFDET